MADVAGIARTNSGGSDFNALDFQIRQILASISTAIPVLVQTVHPAQTQLAPPTVDVQPMVHMVDGSGKAAPHGTIYGLPVARVRAGNSAVIVDPVAGDIGIAVFAHRDITKVLATGAPALPGSSRQLSYSDGIYLMGILGGAPTQAIVMDSTGILVVSPVKITLQAPTVKITAQNPVTITPDAVIAGKDIGTHVHTGVQSGSSNSGPMA